MSSERPAAASFHTHDLDEYYERIAEVAAPHLVQPGGTSFVGSAKLVSLSRLGIFAARLREARILAPDLGGVFSLNVALTGPLQMGSSAHPTTVLPGGAYLAGPERPFDLFTPGDFPVLVVNIAERALAEHIAGRGSTEVTPSLVDELSLSTPSGSRLFEGLSALWGATLSGRAGLPAGVEAEELQDALIESLVSAALPKDESPLRRGVVRARTRAEEYIRAHLGEYLSLPLIAEAAGTSPRTLNRAFRDAHGLTPMAYVRRQRLAAVRRVLMGCEPDETTITRTAADHQFFHLGRFSSAYRLAFGERPSDTLRAV